MNKKFAFFNSKKSHEGLRRNKNGRTCPLNLGPRILKIVIFGACRRLLHPHFGLWIIKKSIFFWHQTIPKCSFWIWGWGTDIITTYYLIYITGISTITNTGNILYLLLNYHALVYLYYSTVLLTNTCITYNFSMIILILIIVSIRFSRKKTCSSGPSEPLGTELVGH